MNYKDVVEKINERLVNSIKNVIKKYNLLYEIKELREVREDHYRQTIVVYYKDYSEAMNIDYLCYMDRIKIEFDQVKICDRKIKNYTNKALEKIENEIKIRAMWIIKDFIEEYKEKKEIKNIENNIAEIFKTVFGTKPDRVTYYTFRNSFEVEYSRENDKELIKVIISCVIENDTIKVQEVRILDNNGNRLPFYLEQIAEIFKMMTAFI